MKKNLRFVAALIGLCVLPLCARAQSYWVLSYQGTSTSGGTNKLTTAAVTEHTFIENCASNSSVSPDNLVLVLHVNANDLGDTLEVVNQNDPNLFHCEIFKLTYTFSGSPSQSYTNSAGTVLKRWAYIFSSDGGHSRGSAIINQRSGSSKAGTNGPVTVDGKLQYWLGTWDEHTSDPNAIVCSGTFKAKEPLNLP
jgi:hypothetical protein